ACRGCDLWEQATQTVFGEGAEHSRMMLIGEQPGDQEDLQGKPFVGPAGRLLEKALDEAGIDRRRVYVTNAVKHFRWTRRGKRRLHEKPNAGQVRACRPWLEAEIAGCFRSRCRTRIGSATARSVPGGNRAATSSRRWCEATSQPAAASSTWAAAGAVSSSSSGARSSSPRASIPTRRRCPSIGRR